MWSTKGSTRPSTPVCFFSWFVLTPRPFVDVLAGQRARAVQQPSQLQEVPVRGQRELDAGASPHVDRADDAGETRGLLRNDAPRARRLRAGRAVDREAAEQHDADGSGGHGEGVSCSLRCVEWGLTPCRYPTPPMRSRC